MENPKEDNNTEDYNSDPDNDIDSDAGDFLDDYILTSPIGGSIHNIIFNYIKDKDDIDKALIELKEKLKQILNN